MSGRDDQDPSEQADLPTAPPDETRPGEDPEGLAEEGGPTDPTQPSG